MFGIDVTGASLDLIRSKVFEHFGEIVVAQNYAELRACDCLLVFLYIFCLRDKYIG